MFQINDNYQKLPGSYLFSTIGKKVAAFSEANPDKTIIRLGIGDVTHRAGDHRGDAQGGRRDGGCKDLSWLCTGSWL